MDPNSDSHVDVARWSNYIYFNYFYKRTKYYKLVLVIAWHVDVDNKMLI